MSDLPKYTLSYNRVKARWELKHDVTDRVVRTFTTKAEATKGGVLENVLGSAGGSVKIKTEDGKFQEERTYPRAKDPIKTKG